MKINNVKTSTTLTKNWKLLLLFALSITTIEQTFAQSPSASPTPQETMRATLYQLNTNGTTNLADGNLTNYNDSYSNGTTDDALKLSNFGENFGILRNTSRLSIEQRQRIYAADTTFFYMWNMQVRSYRLIVTTYNLEHPGLIGFFEDAFLHTSTPMLLNSQNIFNFDVNSTAGSYAPDRFRIVFKNPSLSTLATLFTGFNGRLVNNKIELNWSVNNETGMRDYTLERSFDRIRFSSIYNALATNSGSLRSYQSIDGSFFKGDNYYRVKATGLAGDIQYSSILKINGGGKNQEVLIYPNPVADKKLNILLTAKISGKYIVNLYTSTGSLIPLTPIQMSIGLNSKIVELPASIAPGVYILRITSPENETSIKTINVL